MRCDHCGTEITITVDLTPVVEGVAVPILRRLSRIEAALNAEGVIMTQIDDRLAQVQTEVGDAATSITAATDDVTRALTDLKNSLGGQLTADQAAHFDALDQGVAGLKSAADAIKSAVDTADPAPAEQPTPGDGTVPTAGDGGTLPADSPQV